MNDKMPDDKYFPKGEIGKKLLFNTSNDKTFHNYCHLYPIITRDRIICNKKARNMQYQITDNVDVVSYQGEFHNENTLWR